MAKDKYHNLVRNALENSGWLVTHDPYKIVIGKRRGYIDLGAERIIIAAEKGKEKIAVEIKSFVGNSDLDDFEDALGQFLIYLLALEESEKDRELYLAMPESFYTRFFDDVFFERLIKRYSIKLIVFEEDKPEIVTWIR